MGDKFGVFLSFSELFSVLFVATLVGVHFGGGDSAVVCVDNGDGNRLHEIDLLRTLQQRLKNRSIDAHFTSW